MVKLADPAEESSRRAQRNWGIIVMSLARKGSLISDMFKAEDNKGKTKKKVVKKVAAPPPRRTSNLSSMKRSDSLASMLSNSDVVASNRASPTGSFRDANPNRTPNMSPRVSIGDASSVRDRPLQLQHPPPPRSGGAVSHASHAQVIQSHSPLNRGVSAASIASPPLSPAAGGGGHGEGKYSHDVEAAVSAALPSPRRPRAQLPPPPVDLPNKIIRGRRGGCGGGGSSGWSGADAVQQPGVGGARAGASQRCGSSARIASGQNSGAPARVRLQDVSGGAGGRSDSGSAGVGAAARGVVGVGFAAGAGGGGGSGGGGSSAGSAAVPQVDERHFELPPLGRLPSRESRGLGVGLLPAGYRNVQLPMTPDIEDARLTGLFEFSTNNGDHGNI